jgi:phosphonate transport system permease protein
MLTAELQTSLAARYGNLKLLRAARILGLFCLTFLVAAWQADVNLSELARDLPKGIAKLSEFFPPEWSALPELIVPALETLLLALIPLPLSIVIAIPIAFAASRNIAPPWLRGLTRGYITFQRNIPEIILALLLVRAFGLGPYPGIVAILLVSVGMLAKLLADAIEEIEPQKLDAVATTGARRWQVIRYGILPEVMPSLVANGIFRLDVNIRQAGLLGAVGAGGVGWELHYAINLLEYERVTMTFIVLLTLIALAERLSDFFRKILIDRGSLN